MDSRARAPGSPANLPSAQPGRARPKSFSTARAHRTCVAGTSLPGAQGRAHPPMRQLDRAGSHGSHAVQHGRARLRPGAPRRDRPPGRAGPGRTRVHASPPASIRRASRPFPAPWNGFEPGAHGSRLARVRRMPQRARPGALSGPSRARPTSPRCRVESSMRRDAFGRALAPVRHAPRRARLDAGPSPSCAGTRPSRRSLPSVTRGAELASMPGRVLHGTGGSWIGAALW
jgi:hypothetical protein